MKKKMVSMLLACVMGLSLVACGSSKEATNESTSDDAAVEDTAEDTAEDEATEEVEKTEVTVFAAASMTETLTEIEALYEAENENIDLIFNFDSSGTLKTQIQEGAVCDLFISAGQKQMDQLDITADAEVYTE